ncbi:MAG TPA: glutathione peroxidase [Dokdonella sp.]|uniref:glutathione peroxidase n=1 Tax=Dokdonella sp. TaxID=2291710 RepID=UPI0025C301AF|nr:glutathione peroxidase [Dokdonella sp.]MBX3692284.1 glutathione peroxidase [Dokdonella sp.]MCW5568466.1 glutathione peroxidase [Dokdonella sp.]HNR92551.1 glutathione peroxidase [Dokdonella sp.]
MSRLLIALFTLAVAGGAHACGDLLEDVHFRPLAGKEPVDLCQAHGGKVLLVVNTASKCGYTPQYEGLEVLHAKYAARGFAVLGFPSNDFRNQEPGTEQEIQAFCTLTYGVRFPMFEKVSVKEGAANPFYVKLAEASGGHYPAWNFHKYLLDRNGKVVADYPSKVKPDDAGLVARIEALLGEPE